MSVEIVLQRSGIHDTQKVPHDEELSLVSTLNRILDRSCPTLPAGPIVDQLMGDAVEVILGLMRDVENLGQARRRDAINHL